jgi:hypothetical protein
MTTGRPPEQQVADAARRHAQALTSADEAALRALMHPGLQWTTYTGEVLRYQDSRRITRAQDACQDERKPLAARPERALRTAGSPGSGRGSQAMSRMFNASPAWA